MIKLYTAKVSATGGREGTARSSDGKLQVSLDMPRELGGPADGQGTNPEQLFAAGYAACFDSALRHVARKRKIDVGASKVDAEVSLSPKILGGLGFVLSAKLNVSVPGLDRALAQELVNQAHEVCPYSNATRGNIDVQIRLVEAS